jgi:hypothetical protein
VINDDNPSRRGASMIDEELPKCAQKLDASLQLRL